VNRQQRRATAKQSQRARPRSADEGLRYYRAGRLDQAASHYLMALAEQPDDADTLHLLGVLRHQQGRSEAAVELIAKAVAIRPNYPEAHNDLGNALCALGRTAKGAASYREALRLRPDFADAHNNLGNALWVLGRAAEAAASFGHSLRLRPDAAEAHTNLSYAHLLAGRFEEGWTEYEWRWKTRRMSAGARNFPAPLWRGETIGDRVILLHAEQGLGDTLQFCRYVPLIAPGARIEREVQAPLVRLLSRLPGITQIVARGDSLPSFDMHCPLLSLPRAFGTTLDTIPGTTPYLAADPARAAAWRERLACLDVLRGGDLHGVASRVGDLRAGDLRVGDSRAGGLRVGGLRVGLVWAGG